MNDTMRIAAAAAFIALTLCACGPAGDSGGASLALLSATVSGPRVLAPGITQLSEGTVSYENQDWTYRLLKLEFPDKAAAYAAWLPPRDRQVRPAVLIANPYIGITWNGDAPGPGVEIYTLRQYVENGYLYLLNGFGVLHVFERFYTGGDLQNDVDDTVAGLQYLAWEPLADKSKIGIYGGSWGGFESIYGAANAPAEARPAAGVAFFPPLDFNFFEHFVSVTLPAQITDPVKRTQYQTFFQPYLDRIRATSGWSAWTADALVAKLATPFLVLHDEWDTLVPFSASQELVTKAAGLVSPVWYLQDTPFDINALPYGWGHGELRTEQLDANPPDAFVWGMRDTFATAFLITRLAAPDQTLILGFNSLALDDFVEYARHCKCDRSLDASWAAVRLSDMIDSRAFYIDIATGATATGPDALAAAFTNVNWGSSAYRTPSTVGTALQGGLPPCP